MQCQDKRLGHADCMTRIRQGLMLASMMCEPCCKTYDMDYTVEPTEMQIRLSELYDGRRFE